MAEPITLRVDGQLYSGWQKVRITRSLRDIAGDFELRLTRKWDDAKAMAIKPLSACTVSIGNDLVLTGYIDDFIPSYDAREVEWVVTYAQTALDRHLKPDYAKQIVVTGSIPQFQWLQLDIAITRPDESTMTMTIKQRWEAQANAV